MAARSPQARWILRINGLVAGIFGIFILAAASPLSELFGLDSPVPVIAAGLGIAFLGADALLVSVRRGLRRLHVLPFAAIAAATVAGAVMALVFGAQQIEPAGEVLLVGVAAVAAAFALTELRAGRDL